MKDILMPPRAAQAEIWNPQSNNTELSSEFVPIFNLIFTLEVQKVRSM